MSNNVTWDGSTYIHLSLDLVFDDIINANAEKCVARLKETSPDGVRVDKKYKDGWTVKKGRKTKNQYYAEVWNETNWQLTHLLENGHLIVNKREGVGWAEAKPHIQKALDSVKPQFISEMERVELDLKIET